MNAESLAAVREAYRQSLDVLSTQGFCVYGQYPWDGWERMALLREVPEALANLGRAVMREADQHMWEPQLKVLCGWADEGEAMIELALQDPDRVRYVWQKLLDTDGCRGTWDKKTGATCLAQAGNGGRMPVFDRNHQPCSPGASVMEMKARRSQRRKPSSMAEYLDALEEHGWSANAVAQLLWLCGDLGKGAVVDAETVGRAGFVLTRELEQMNAALERLREEIGRR